MTLTKDDLLKRTTEDGDCLIWTGSLIHGNAPVFSEGGKKLYAKRRILEGDGAQVAGLFVTSTCGNKLCVYPAHLLATTKADIARRTASSGAWSTPQIKAKVAHAKRKASKLSQESVRAIRASEKPVKAIAASYGITETYAYMIRRGDWRREYNSPFAGLGAL